ncbi:hypothetical protein J2S55_001880 [Streptosporangium brasiliense]|uniref:Uncharacterized protein n=1 Tax=Streptosporangium brasiliense TaxID=47480 RepID=A0ABT9R076_9ACTN|nr:hypothetical protein [Streptosporangium brasiliense]
MLLQCKSLHGRIGPAEVRTPSSHGRTRREHGSPIRAYGSGGVTR